MDDCWALYHQMHKHETLFLFLLFGALLLLYHTPEVVRIQPPNAFGGSCQGEMVSQLTPIDTDQRIVGDNHLTNVPSNIPMYKIMYWRR